MRGQMKSTVELGNRLVSILTEMSVSYSDDFRVVSKPYRLPDRNELEDWNGRGRAEELVEELARRLVNANRDSSAAERPRHSGTLGSRTINGALRKIRRGYLLPEKRVPLLRRVPADVIYFIATLPGGKDFLLREHHGPVGWHYHYLDKAQRRTNVILSWEDLTQGIQTPHPLFYERHAEGKSTVKARPERWEDEKRESMHRACSGDLRNSHWKPDAFRRAAAKAVAVWPRCAVPSAKVRKLARP